MVVWLVGQVRTHEEDFQGRGHDVAPFVQDRVEGSTRPTVLLLICGWSATRPKKDGSTEATAYVTPFLLFVDMGY